MNVSGPGVLLAIAAAGAFGAVLRYALDIAITAAQHRRADTSARVFPWGILAANTLACLLVGAAVSRASAHGIGMDVAAIQGVPALLAVALVLGVGGSLSTMSTFIVAAVALWRDGARAMALSYAGLTLGAGLAAGCAGTLLAPLLP